MEVEYTLLSLLSSSLRVVTLVLMIDFLGGLINKHTNKDNNT